MALSAIRLRASSRALEMVAPCLPQIRHPSANSIHLWLLRFGHAQLNAPKEQADDWIWMFDHTIQTGNGKCLVVLGIRLSDWFAKKEAFRAKNPEGCFSLSYEDMVPFETKRVDRSTGEDVCADLQAISVRTGITPAYLLSDQGADVRKGGQLFSEQVAIATSEERRPRPIFDIAHATANALKRQLNKNDDWNAFNSQANHFKTKIRQGPLAFLMPPDIKRKARWMNLQPLIDWSTRMEAVCESPHQVFESVLGEKLTDESASERASRIETLVEQSREKLRWLEDYRSSLAQWRITLTAVSIILKFIRNEGYHPGAASQLREELSSIQGEMACHVIEEILEFIESQSATPSAESPSVAVLGTTEILESLIGAGKQLQGANKNGYTGSILAMAASVGKLSLESVRESLTRVKVADTFAWIQSNIGPSLQSQRLRASAALNGTNIG